MEIVNNENIYEDKVNESTEYACADANLVVVFYRSPI